MNATDSDHMRLWGRQLDVNNPTSAASGKKLRFTVVIDTMYFIGMMVQ